MIEEELSPVYTTPEEIPNTDETPLTEGIPQEMSDPLSEEFERPATEAYDQLQQERMDAENARVQEELAIRRDKIGAIETDLIDQRPRTQGDKISAVRNFIVATSGKSVRSEQQFNAGMDKAWKALGGKGIAPSVDAVFDKLQKASVDGKKANDQAQEFFKKGAMGVLSPDLYSLQRSFAQQGYTKEQRQQLTEAYKKGKEAQRARLGDRNIAEYKTIIEQVNSGVDFDDISESVADYTLDMDGREKITFLSGMREALSALPPEQRNGLIDTIANNGRISLERAGDMVTNTVKTVIKGVKGARSSFQSAVAQGMEEGSEEAKVADAKAREAKISYDTSLHYADMERSVKDILMEKVEPLDYLSDDHSIARLFEEGVYQIPQVAVSIGTVASPMILGSILKVGGVAMASARATGAVAGLSLSTSEVMESKRQGYLAGGADFESASQKAASLDTYAQALPHFFIERMQVAGLARKSKLIDSIMGKLDKTIRNRGSRFGAKFMAQGAIQTAEEMGQDVYTEMVKKVTSVFDSEMAHVDWMNGKDGIFDEFWAKSAVTFVSMAPFSAFSAGGLMSAEHRADAWAKLPDLHLKAYGYDQPSIDKLKSADNPRDRVRAYTDAELGRDGFSENAKDATQEIAEAVIKQQEAVAQSQYNGEFPNTKISYADGSPSYKVYDPETDELLIDTDSPTEASKVALDWADQKTDENEAQFIFLNTLMKASAQMAELRPESEKILNAGKVMTDLKRIAENPDQARRVMDQARREEMRNGGNGDITELVFGKPIYGDNVVKMDESGQIKAIDNIYKGGNIRTLIHEDGHAGFKMGVQRGIIDLQDTIRLFRGLDKVMGDRKTRASSFGKDATPEQPLRFLPSDAEPTFMEVDEAAAELWEALILGEGRFGSMRELISENMKAYAQMGVGNTITNFIKALRHYFNLALTRAMAIKKAVRDGEIDQKDIDAFRAKMQGTTEQEQITEQARKEYEETLRPAFEEESYSMGAVPEAIEESPDPLVKHIYLKEDGKFYQKMKDGYIVVDQSLDEFEGMAIMLHQPDGAMAGTVEVDGNKVVDGKGGVYYPVMFGDQGYFWASTRDAAKGMAKSLNAISKRNNGTILMALTSAPIEKMFSSTTMATGALDLFATLAKNPKKYGVTKVELNNAIAKASQQELVITETNIKRFSRPLKATDSLAKNLREMKKNLLPDNSTFPQRGAFVQQVADSIAKHMKLPTKQEQRKLKGDDKIAFELKQKQALNIAALLASDKNLYNLTDIPKGTLAKASVMQGMADLFAEPLVKTFQQLDKGKQSGRIYAVLEMKGEVEAVEVGDHESYPFTLRSTSGQTPVVHVLKKSNRWQDVVYAAPNKKNKKDAQPLYDGNTNPVKKADESSIFPPSSGVSMRELIVRKPDEGAEALELSYSMADTARHGIMKSIEERVDKPEIKAEMLGDALRNVQKLIDQTEKLQAELKTVKDDGKTLAQKNLEEKLRQLETEIEAMDQAYDNDVKMLEAEHEMRKGDIGEDIVSQFAHRVDVAKGSKKRELKREAKAREAERKKGEDARFKLEKKNLKARLKAEKAKLETEAEKVRTNLATKDKASQRKLIRSMLVTYEAMIMALPTDIRGKMGKAVRIADINTDEKILEFFDKKLNRMERVMDSYVGKRFTKSMKTLMKRATVKMKVGKKDVGTMKAQIHDIFQGAKDVVELGETEVMAEIAKVEALIEGKEGEPQLTATEIDTLKKKKIMMQLFGNWKELTNPEKEAALVNGWREFEYNYTLSKMEREEARAKRLADISEAIEATGITADDANYYADLKEAEGNKLMSRMRSAAYGLVDFEQFLTKIFGKDSKVLDFVIREQKADAQKIDRMKMHQDAVTRMFEEIAGSSNLGVKATKLQFDMQQTRYVTKTQKRSLTQMQMIQARLMWRQADGRRHMEGRFDEEGNRLTSWSYDQKFMDEIDSLMTDQGRAVEQFLIEQYQGEWADLNAVHQRVQNATLPRNNMYAPLTVAPAIKKEGEMIDPLSGQSIKHMNGSNAFLLRRNKGAVAEPVFRDALSTYLIHKTQVEHWMAYAELNKDFSTIANSREARNSVVAKVGEEGLATLDGWSNVFVNNGLMQSYADSELAKKMNRAVSRTSQAILFGRLSVLAIQSTQLGAAAAQMPTKSYAKRLGMLMTGQLEFKKAFNSAFIQRRMSEAPPAVRLAMQNMASGNPNTARAAAEKMGTLIAGTDAFFTAGTYAIILDYLTTNRGMSDKDAHAEAERLTEQVAQPTRMGRKSLMEMQFSRQPTAKLAWAFASEPRQKMMLMAFRMSENGVLSKEAGRAAITTVVFGGVFASLIRAIAADVRDDDDDEVFDSKYWNPYRLALQSVTAPLQGIPVFGDIAEYLLLSSFKAMGVDTGYLYSGSDMLSNAKDSGFALIKLGVSLSDLAQQDPDAEVEESLKHLDRFLSGMGVFNNNAAAAASFSHLLKDLFMIGKNIAK